MKLGQSIILIGTTFALAPLEPDQPNSIYLYSTSSYYISGSWWNRLYGGGDTPSNSNSRLGVLPLSFFQCDFHMTDKVAGDDMDGIISQIEDTKTDAFAFLTIYPAEGFDVVTDSAIADFAQRVAKITSTGRAVMIRYGSEMNGCWFKYGQQPTKFKEQWKKLVLAVRKVANNKLCAFIWGPNSANGYPFSCPYNAASNGTDVSLDTNGDGLLNASDDPYSPYYPGDEYVDWVGLSAYHYGKTFPWETNLIPDEGKAEAILTGKPPYGTFNFYEMFSGSGSSVSKGGKPFIFTETGVATHLAVEKPDKSLVIPEGTDPITRANFKQVWWRQLLNTTFLSTYPKVKGFSLFEYVKLEESSWRDFTILGEATSLNSPIGNDAGPKDGPTLEAFRSDLQGDYGKLILWAKGVDGMVGGAWNAGSSGSPRSPGTNNPNPLVEKNGCLQQSSGVLIMIIFIIFEYI